MYKFLTPFRSIRKNATRYAIFGLLLMLLLILMLTVRTVGDAAARQTAQIIERYACTFVCFNQELPLDKTCLPADDVDFFLDYLPSLPHVARTEVHAFHSVNKVVGLRMIGAPASYYEETPLEGRMYENETECVINESYAKYLREMGVFTDVGDTITVTDDDNWFVTHVLTITSYAGRYVKFDPNFVPYVSERPMQRQYTVVGILSDDATPYHYTPVYGRWRVYTTTDGVTPFYEGLENNLQNGQNGFVWNPNELLRRPLLRKKVSYTLNEEGTSWLWWDASSQVGRTMYDPSITLMQLAPNEGIVGIVVLDDPSYGETFLRTVCGAKVLDILKNTKPSITVDGADGKQHDLYDGVRQYWYAVPMMAQTETLAASLAPIAPLCDSIAKAATAATVILILLMTILLVHDRQYEIGVLRCMGVTSGGVCARFVAEILVFLVIVAAIGLALAVPAARLAAGYLGLGDALGSVFATAGTQLALIAAATVVSCVLAAAMILAKRPMEILNSRT